MCYLNNIGLWFEKLSKLKSLLKGKSVLSCYSIQGLVHFKKKKTPLVINSTNKIGNSVGQKAQTSGHGPPVYVKEDAVEGEERYMV